MYCRFRHSLCSANCLQEYEFTLNIRLFVLIVANKSIIKIHFLHILEDITPPKLTFTNAPAITLGNVKITWTFDEDVAVQTCTLQTPESTFIVQACNNSWSLLNLVEGLYNLYIEAIDLEGNTSPSSRHTWRVGKNIDSISAESFIIKGMKNNFIQNLTFVLKLELRAM